MTISNNATSTLRNLVLFLMVCLGSGFFLLHFTKHLPYAYAVGCDSYGYLKQAQLFKDKGPVSGLSTAIADSEAQFLINIASKINHNLVTWSEIVAPNCHHYDKTTEQIILQYPPGTGFFLSILPSDKELQTLSILMISSTIFLYALINIIALSFRKFLFSSIIFYIVLASIVKFQVPSYSIPVSFAIIPWLTIVLFFIKPIPNIKNYFLAIALGSLCGFVVDVRIASLLVTPGVAAILFIKLFFNKLHTKIKPWIIPTLTLLFFMVTVSPLLYFNVVNAGGPINSTYATYDKELRFTNIDLFLNNLQYYVADNSASVITALTLSFLLIQLVFKRVQQFSSHRLNVIALLVLFIFNLIFFCLKPIAIDYYFLPVSIFCLYYSLLDFAHINSNWKSSDTKGFKPFSSICFLVILAGFCLYKINHEPSQKIQLDVPEIVLNKQSILYAGITGGTINYYLGKYTSKLDFGSHCIVEQLLGRVALAGKDQFIVNDTPKMNELIEGIGIDKFQKIGVFKDASSTFDIFKYTNSKLRDLPLISCDLSVTKSLATNLSLTISGAITKGQFKGVLTIVNRGDQSFSTRPIAGPVKVSWRFVDSKGTVAPPPWEKRLNLTMMIAAKSEHQIPFTAELPQAPGQYLLEVTLVQEGFAWFQDLGMKPATLTVIVDQ